MPVTPPYTSPFGGLIQGILGPTANQRNLQFQQEQSVFGFQKEQAAASAVAKVTQQAAKLLASGVPPTQLYQQMLNDPAFISAFAEGADPNAVVKGISDTILEYTTPKVLTPGAPGATPGTQTPGQPPVYGQPFPTTDMQNAKAGLDPSGGRNLTAEEVGLTNLVARGIIDQNYMDKFRANQIQVQQRRDAFNQAVTGYDVIDIVSGKNLKFIPADADSNAAFQNRSGGGLPGAPQAVAGQPQGGNVNAGPGSATANGATAAGGAPGSPMQPYRNGIRAVESGGSSDPYGLLGPLVTYSGGHTDRAYGAYQVMGDNIGPWTQEVLGRTLTPREFLADQDAQDKVFDAKFGQYLTQYGNPNDAASVWFSGRPQAQAGNSSDGYTTVPEYIRKFNAGMGQAPAGGGSPGSRVTVAAPGQAATQSLQPPLAGPNKGTPDGLTPAYQPVSKILAKPTDMFLGAGTLPAIGEFASGTVSGLTGGGNTNNDITAQRQALANYRFALGELSSSSRILKADRDNLSALGPNLSPLNVSGNPTDEITHALQVLELMDSFEQSATQDLQNNRTSPEVKAQAATDLSAINRVRNAIPSRSEMNSALADLKAGKGGQYGPGALINDLKGLFVKGEKSLEQQGVVPGANNPANPAKADNAVDRRGEIAKFKTADELNKWVSTVNPIPTVDEMNAVYARIKELYSGLGGP